MQDEKTNWRVFAPLLVIFAGVCWGIISLFSQTLSGLGLSSPQITTVRAVIAALVLGLFLLVTDREGFRIDPKDLWMFAGSGILSIAFFNVCYFACMNECNVSIACVLLYTAPCFVTVMARIFFKELLTLRKMLCLVVAFVGCALVVGLGSGEGGASLLGIAVGLGSGIGYALYSIFGGFALKKYKPATFTFYTFLFTALAMTPFSQPGQIVALATSNGVALAAMVTLAVLCTVIPFGCYTVGLAHLEASKASIMAFVEPLVALLVGAVVFHDALTLLNMVGVVCILGAVLALNLAPAAKDADSKDLA